ncbi:hypothetical protein B484DRAFT_394211 [Ochromonadaceae sp. CCMP2298]|nr:hypothetical protein B484DRAFT_394211 [Ochromonadaceae sp. CCMP2298]
MGANASKPAPAGPAAAEGGCPVQHKAAEGCPVKDAKGQYKNPSIFNVYSVKQDPTNNMPAANQQPSPDQTMPLSTTRVVSGIPKGGTEGGWTYPSPQMVRAL